MMLFHIAQDDVERLEEIRDNMPNVTKQEHQSFSWMCRIIEAIRENPDYDPDDE